MSEKRDLVKRRLNTVFHEVFGDDSIEIFDSMSAADLDEWDSLMHISLVVATETAFKVRLNMADVAKLENVGAMIDLLLQKAPIDQIMK